jgi:hypothetical protein
MNSRHLLCTPNGHCSKVGNLNVGTATKEVTSVNFYL